MKDSSLRLPYSKAPLFQILILATLFNHSSMNLREENKHYVLMKVHFDFKFLNDQQNILWTHIYRENVANEITCRVNCHKRVTSITPIISTCFWKFLCGSDSII